MFFIRGQIKENNPRWHYRSCRSLTWCYYILKSSKFHPILNPKARAHCVIETWRWTHPQAKSHWSVNRATLLKPAETGDMIQDITQLCFHYFCVYVFSKLRNIHHTIQAHSNSLLNCNIINSGYSERQQMSVISLINTCPLTSTVQRTSQSRCLQMRDARIIRGLVSMAVETPEDHTLHDYIYFSVTRCFAWKKFVKCLQTHLYVTLSHSFTAKSLPNPVKQRCLVTIQCHSRGKISWSCRGWWCEV